MKIIKQIGIFFTVCWLSSGSGSVFTFLISIQCDWNDFVFICLLAGVFENRTYSGKSRFFRKNMAFFFVPAGVSVMNYFDILKSTLVPFLIICIVSTIITFAATAYSVQFVMKLMNRRKK